MTVSASPSKVAERPRISCASVSLRIRDADLLTDVSLDLRDGEFVGIIGPNGSGKSTLLRLLLGSLAPTEGTILVTGCESRRISARTMARTVSRVPQNQASPQGFTARDIVMMGRYPHLGTFQVEGKSDERIVAHALATLDATTFAPRDVATLSGGERQRVFVARVLAQETPVILLDEPTSNLDLKHQLLVLEVMARLVAAGGLVIAALHELSLAARFCSRLIMLSGGLVVADGCPSEVLTSRLIQEVFGVTVSVVHDPESGTPAIIPFSASGVPTA